MKTLSALIFCISVILLVYLSGATNKGKRYLQTLTPVEIFASVECLETCAARELVTVIPADSTVNMLARIKGQTTLAARVEYQGKAGWFTLTEANARILRTQNIDNTEENADAK